MHHMHVKPSPWKYCSTVCMGYHVHCYINLLYTHFEMNRFFWEKAEPFFSVNLWVKGLGTTLFSNLYNTGAPVRCLLNWPCTPANSVCDRWSLNSGIILIHLQTFFQSDFWCQAFFTRQNVICWEKKRKRLKTNGLLRYLYKVARIKIPLEWLAGRQPGHCLGASLPQPWLLRSKLEPKWTSEKTAREANSTVRPQGAWDGCHGNWAFALFQYQKVSPCLFSRL